MAVVYIRMRNRVQAKGNQTVRIKDIARIIGPEEVIRKIEEIILLTVKKEDKNIIVIDLAQVIMAIRKVDPTIEVETFGPFPNDHRSHPLEKENVIPDIRLSLVFVICRRRDDDHEFPCGCQHGGSASKNLYYNNGKSGR